MKKRAHVFINGRFLTQRLTGVQRYALEVSAQLQQLISHRDDLSMKIYMPSRNIPNEQPLPAIPVGFLAGQLWEQLVLPWYKSGCLMNLCNTFPLLGRRQLVVFHDASIYAATAGYAASFVLWYRLLLLGLRLRKNDKIVTDSEFSRHEISRYTGISTSRISVVYCGADHWGKVSFDESILEKLGLSGRRYLLAVGSTNVNKNLDRLISAYLQLNRPEIPLVLVGGANAKVFSDADEIDAVGVLRAGYVSDSELAALYSEAIAFIFPSLYEGFGLPPLEAMTFGCPVISSREASLPEVCGDAALYCDAYSVENISECIRQMLDDEVLRISLITAGKARVEKFKWERTAQELLKLAEGLT